MLSAIDRIRWEHNAATLLPANPATLWDLAHRWAMGRIGYGMGDRYESMVNQSAESLLSEIGVGVEHHAGQRYIAGMRVYLSNRTGRFEQDSFRP